MYIHRAIIIVAVLAFAGSARAQVPSQLPPGSGGPSTPQKGVFSGISSTIAIGATDFISNGISTTVISARPNAATIMPYGGTASNLFCSFATPSVTAGPTITVGVNQVNSALTMTCTVGATTCSVTNLTATFTQGQTLDIQVNNAANAAATGEITCAFQIS